MKKYLAIVLALVIIAALTSCARLPNNTEPTQSPQSSEPSELPASPPASPSPSLESATALFLTGEPTALGISQYLSYNASHFSTEDGDLLLERLLLLQLDISSDMNSRIWDNAYMTALNETLGGVLDAAKIPNIKSETVRRDFQNVADSLMTMVRYEETPVFEPDWAALEGMKAVFSKQAGVMIDYQNRLQGRYYYGDPYNFDLLATDIAAVEQALKETDSGFVRWQLAKVYKVQVSRMLYGPEGSYLSMFMSGDKRIINNIEKYAEEYPGTAFGGTCKKLLALRGEGDQAVSNAISDSLVFIPGTPGGLERTNSDYNGAALELPQLMGLKDAAVTAKINDTVLGYAKALVQTGRESQQVSCYIGFVNDRFINFVFSYSYIQESDMSYYTESSLTLNLSTGAAVTLDDLVGKPLSSYKTQLLEAISTVNLPQGTDIPKDLQAPISFMLTSGELTITVPSPDSDWPDYFAVTWNGLRSFMDVSQLY